MGERQPLAAVLQRYLAEAGYTPKGLAGATAQRYTVPVPYKTIDHWCHGRAARVHNDEQLLKVAATLGLNRVRATRLLLAAGKPPVEALLAQARDPARLALLAPWATARPHNLPAPLTTFVGREAESLDRAEALSNPALRLLTLTGPGGSGKTRLALRVAEALLDACADGVWFVPLAALRDPALVAPAIARALGLRNPDDAAIDARLAGYLRERRLLLVLDNLEGTVRVTFQPRRRLGVRYSAHERTGCRAQLQTPSLPAADHRPCRLAVFPLRPQLPRRGGAAGGAWGTRHLRDDPPVVP